MLQALLVGLGGFLGTVLRYAVTRIPMGWSFPLSTLVVNVVGCLALGLLAGARVPETARAFVFIGVLGGFTTFSAFALDTTVMWERHDWAAAVIYAGSSVFLSIAGLIAGMFIVRVQLS